MQLWVSEMAHSVASLLHKSMQVVYKEGSTDSWIDFCKL